MSIEFRKGGGVYKQDARKPKVNSESTRQAAGAVLAQSAALIRRRPTSEELKSRDKSSAEMASTKAERMSGRLTDAGHQLREGTGRRVGSKEEMQDAHLRAAEAHRAAQAMHGKVATNISMKSGDYSGDRDEEEHHFSQADWHGEQAKAHEEQAQSSEWDESKHPRDAQGKFS